MTFDAWRGALGAAWRRLLIYPGGLSTIVALVLGWLVWRWLIRPPRSTLVPAIPHPLDALALAGAWVAIATLPVPQAGELPAILDLPTAWLLLDLPLALLIWRGWRETASQQLAATRLLGGWLVAAPLLTLVLALIGSSVGSLVLSDIAAIDGPVAWMLGVVWLAALLPALHIGPWSVAVDSRTAQISLTLRRLGHCALLALLVLSRWPEPATAADNLWVTVRRDGRVPFGLTLLIIWLLLVLLQRLGRRGNVVRWGRGVWAVGGLVLLALAWLQIRR